MKQGMRAGWSVSWQRRFWWIIMLFAGFNVAMSVLYVVLVALLWGVHGRHALRPDDRANVPMFLLSGGVYALVMVAGWLARDGRRSPTAVGRMIAVIAGLVFLLFMVGQVPQSVVVIGLAVALALYARRCRRLARVRAKEGEGPCIR